MRNSNPEPNGRAERNERRTVEPRAGLRDAGGQDARHNPRNGVQGGGTAAGHPCLVIGAACWFAAPPGHTERTTAKAASDLPPDSEELGLFHGWPKPDFVIVLS